MKEIFNKIMKFLFANVGSISGGVLGAFIGITLHQLLGAMVLAFLGGVMGYLGKLFIAYIVKIIKKWFK